MHATPHYAALIDQSYYAFETNEPRTPALDSLAWEVATKYAAMRNRPCEGLHYVGVTTTPVPPPAS